MRLHRLAVADYKGIGEREVTFPESGVLVLEGPNEVGKSSLLEALDLLLDHKDSSRRAEVRAAQPVGRDVAPRVEVEMSTGPYRFTYRKQWRKQPRTELDVVEPRRVQLVGDEAHVRVRAMLEETTDLQLWRALRLLQATPLSPADLSGSTALAAALDAAAGSAHDAGPAGESLLSAAEAVYLRFFTAKSGQPTGEYRTAIDRLERAQEAVDAAREALDEVSADVARHERLTLEAQESRARSVAAREALADLEARWAEVAGVQEALDEARRRRDRARHDAERAQERAAERRELARAVAARSAAVAEHDEALAQLRRNLDPLEERLASLTAEHAAARQTREDARAGLDRAREDVERARDAADLAALDSRIERIDAAALARTRAEADAARWAVTPRRWQGIEAAAREVDIAVAAHSAGSATVRVGALAPGRRVQVGDETWTVEPGDDRHLALGERTTLVVPGEVSLHFHPEAGAAQRAREVEEAQGRLAALLEEAGVADVEAAREAHDARREAQAEERRAAEVLGDLLDGDDRGELVDRREALRERLDRRGDEAPGADGDPDPAARLDAARAAEDEARADAARVAARLETARTEADRMRIESARTESLLDAVRRELHEQGDRLAAQRATRDDETLEAQLRAAGEALEAAEREVVAREEDLRRQDAEGVHERLEGVRSELPAHEQRRREVEDERIRVEARLEHAGSEGRNESFDRAMSELEHARRVHDGHRRHAEAARLLHSTLQGRSQAAKAAYVRPFTEAIARFGRIVYGPDFEVEVDDDLRIEARHLGGDRIPYAALSSGAKEQLAIITRLACATLVGADDAVPVVIDDALGYSDPDKLRRVCAAFGRLGSHAQVLLLTCTPGRYAAIGDAEVVRL